MSVDRGAKGAYWWVKAPLPKGWRKNVRALAALQGITTERLVERAIGEYVERYGAQLTEVGELADDADSDEAA